MPQLLSRAGTTNPNPSIVTSSSTEEYQTLDIPPKLVNLSTLPGSGLGPAWLTKTKFHDQLPPALQSRQGYLQVGDISKVYCRHYINIL